MVLFRIGPQHVGRTEVLIVGHVGKLTGDCRPQMQPIFQELLALGLQGILGILLLQRRIEQQAELRQHRQPGADRAGPVKRAVDRRIRARVDTQAA